MTDGLHHVTERPVLDGPVASVEAETWALTRPDAHLALVRDGALVARASVWHRGPPRPDGARTGCVGHAAWPTAADGRAVLAAALDALRTVGCAHALGPLDGSTWFSYRVVTEWGTAPPFWLEPPPQPVVAEAFAAAGFSPVAHYLSSRVDRLPDHSGMWADDRRQLAARGISVRPLDPAHAEAELGALYPLLLRAFADNPFYTPLERERFLALYGALVPHVDPALVLLAEREGAPVGVVLGLPNLAQPARGEALDTLIVKTLAVDPTARGVGLGAALVRGVQEAARARGLSRAVHALMHAENPSVRISDALGTPFRRYALLGRAL